MARVVVLKSTSREATPELMREMFLLRRKVFKDRLKWDIRCTDGLDLDYFDCLGPVYGLYFGDDGALEGSWRLLPTTGPYMIRNLFPELLDGKPPPKDPDIWEISRFSMLPTRRTCDSLAGNYRIANALLIALLDYSLEARLRHVIAASDTRFERILKRAGTLPRRLGGVHRIGSVASVAGWIDVTPEHRAHVANFAEEPKIDITVLPEAIARRRDEVRHAVAA